MLNAGAHVEAELDKLDISKFKIRIVGSSLFCSDSLRSSYAPSLFLAVI